MQGYIHPVLLYVRPSTLANGFAPFEFAKALLEIETQINTMIETLIWICPILNVYSDRNVHRGDNKRGEYVHVYSL